MVQVKTKLEHQVGESYWRAVEKEASEKVVNTKDIRAPPRIRHA